MLSGLGQFGSSDIDKMFDEADLNRDGTIDYREFVEMMTRDEIMQRPTSNSWFPRWKGKTRRRYQ